MFELSYFTENSLPTLRRQHAWLRRFATTAAPSGDNPRTFPAAGKYRHGIDSPTPGAQSAGLPAGQGGAL